MFPSPPLQRSSSGAPVSSFLTSRPDFLILPWALDWKTLSWSSWPQTAISGINKAPGLGCLQKGLWAATPGDPAPATSDPDPLNLLPGLREVASLGGTFSLWLASGLSSMCSRAKPGGGGSDLVPHHSWRSYLITGALRGEDRVPSSFPAMPIPGPQPPTLHQHPWLP